jgi:hypothetical protein
MHVYMWTSYISLLLANRKYTKPWSNWFWVHHHEFITRRKTALEGGLHGAFFWILWNQHSEFLKSSGKNLGCWQWCFLWYYKISMRNTLYFVLHKNNNTEISDGFRFLHYSLPMLFFHAYFVFPMELPHLMFCSRSANMYICGAQRYWLNRNGGSSF